MCPCRNSRIVPRPIGTRTSIRFRRDSSIGSNTIRIPMCSCSLYTIDERCSRLGLRCGEVLDRVLDRFLFGCELEDSFRLRFVRNSICLQETLGKDHLRSILVVVL
jgi:hypothetical protein